MIAIVAQWKHQIDQVDPRLWNVLIAFVVGALVFAFKKLCPKQWSALPSRFKVLPATAIGALLSGSAGTSAATVLVDAIYGSFAGLTAAGGHVFWERIFQEGGQAPPMPLSSEHDPQEDTKEPTDENPS